MSVEGQLEEAATATAGAGAAAGGGASEYGEFHESIAEVLDTAWDSSATKGLIAIEGDDQRAIARGGRTSAISKASVSTGRTRMIVRTWGYPSSDAAVLVGVARGGNKSKDYDKP